MDYRTSSPKETSRPQPWQTGVEPASCEDFAAEIRACRRLLGFMAAVAATKAGLHPPLATAYFLSRAGHRGD